jgi:hypothetical protein
LRGYDYSKSGLNYITICTEDWKCLFGKIVPDGKIKFPSRIHYEIILNPGVKLQITFGL